MLDYCVHNENGELVFNDFVIPDLVSKYGSPLEIVDTRMITRRANEWRKLCEGVAKEVGYDGGFEYFYASKANMGVEYVKTAYKAGWYAETTSLQDLVHVCWLQEQGLLPEGFKVVANGYKSFRQNAYAEKICAMHRQGYCVIPVFEQGEMAYFAQQSFLRTMPVGVRMKFGKVRTNEELAHLVSRHGMEWESLVREAEAIASHPHLKLELFHAMVGSAELISVDVFVSAILFAVDKYFQLKKIHPTLRYFDIGGGIASPLTGYDYHSFLSLLLNGIKILSGKYGLEPPCLVWECGTYLVEESTVQVYSTMQRFRNDDSGVWWYILDGGLMAGLPDMLVTQKAFPVMAGNYGHAEKVKVRLGDISCDTDGRYPVRGAEPDFVELPDVEGGLVVIGATGAYQRMLSGAVGAHHCGILNPGRLVIEEVDGVVKETYTPAQTEQEYLRLMGYSVDRNGSA